MDTVIFDLDDTLYSRMEPIRQAACDFMKDDPDFNFDTFYEVFQGKSLHAFEMFACGEWSLGYSHIYRIQATLADFGVHISDGDAGKFQDMYEQKQREIQPAPYVLELLEFLKGKPVQMLVLTNGPSIGQRQKIADLGLGKYFPDSDIVVSDEEGIAKPDEKIFQITENRFDLAGQEVLFIGDSYENDIVGGADFGWSTIWLDLDKSARNMKENVATHTVESTRELADILRELVSE